MILLHIKYFPISGYFEFAPSSLKCFSLGLNMVNKTKGPYDFDLI